MRDTIYGVDIKLTQTGDVAVNANGDLALISGLDNLKQAIRILLRTPQGWFFEAPTYGSRLEHYWGKPNTPQTRYSAARDVQEALMADPRIIKVENIYTRQVGEDRFDMEMAIIPAGQTDKLNYVYPMQL